MLKLRPITREIFMAHRLDGLSYAEIADRTGLSVKGVEKHMSKAIAQVTRSRRRGCIAGPSLSASLLAAPDFSTA